MIEKLIYERKCEVYDTPLRVSFSGKMSSGKTTLSNSLLEIYNLERISFAKYLKIYCSDICKFNKTGTPGTLIETVLTICKYNDYDVQEFMGTTIDLCILFKDVEYEYNPNANFSVEIKTDSSRKMLQYVGNFMREQFDNDIWVNCLFKSLDPNGRSIVDDARYPNEIQALKENNFFLIRLEVSEEEQERRILAKHGVYDKSVLSHITETLLDNYPFDFYINANTEKKNVLMKGISIVNQIDYLSSKIYDILKCGDMNDYRRTVLMEFKDSSLEERDTTAYYSSRYGPNDSKEYLT